METTQEETTQRTVALTVKTEKFTEEILKKALELYLYSKAREQTKHKGKISVKELMKMDQGAQTMEIGSGSIRTFNRVAKKYNITYSVQKDKSGEVPKYIVFFRGKDQDVLAKAFADYCNINEKKKKRVSVIQKLKNFREAIRNAPKKERNREKKKDRENVL